MNTIALIIGIYLIIGIACYYFLTQESAKQNSNMVGKFIFFLISPPYLAYLLLKMVTSKK